MTGAAAPFGLGSAAAGPHRLSRTAMVVVSAVATVLAAGAVAGALLGRPTTAVHTTAFAGSAVIDDALGGPVVVDLADAAPTLRLDGVAAQVGTTDAADVQAVPLTGGTLLVDDVTGTVNFVDPDQLVVAASGSGVALPGPPGATGAVTYPDGAQAFVARLGPGASVVSLVGRSTVAVAALLESGSGTGGSGTGGSGTGGSGTGTGGSSAGHPASGGTAPATVPVATATLPPLLAGGTGTAVAAAGRLWALVEPAGGPVHVVRVSPPHRPGGSLSVVNEGHVVRLARPPTGTAGSTVEVPAALASSGGRRPAVVLATARGLTVLDRPGPGHDPARPLRLGQVGQVRTVVPVSGTDGWARFLYGGSRGWFLVGIDPVTGRTVGPVPLKGTARVGLAPAAAPAPGAAAGGAAAGTGAATGASSAGAPAGGASSAGAPAGGASSAGAPLGGAPHRGGGGASTGGGAVIEPVADQGSIYLMTEAAPGARPVVARLDPATGRVLPLRIPGDPSGAYPLIGPAEQPTWAGEQILADGPRVVVNNPDSELAVVVFTDGSHRPVLVDKGAAVDINPAAAPGDLVAPPGTVPPPTTPTPAPSTPTTHVVDTALTCRTTTQKPNVPQVAPPQPATHAVALSWTYPLIDSADCEPSSYTVTVTALGGASEPANPTVSVTGQTAVTVTGLLSDTTYSFVVTAWINRGSTSAPPVEATTAAEGPAAAASVTAAGNGSTGWDVAWQPCTASCVSTEPVAAWIVTGSACGGSFIGQLPTVEVPGPDHSVTVPFTAGLDLVGANLGFSVQPVGVDGLMGDPTSDGMCTEGWAPPQASQITLNVAEPAVSSGATAQAVLTVTPPPSASNAAIYGSDRTELVYSVGGQRLGPVTADQVTFSGLQLGVAYATAVTVYPAGHPEAAVTVAGPPVRPTEPWPADLAMTATGETFGPAGGTVTATITDAFGGLPSGVAENLQAAGQVVCGNVATAVSPTAVQPVPGGTDGQVTVPLSASAGELGGACTLTLSLSEVGTDYHGGSSPSLSAPFGTVAPGKLTATWDPAPAFPYNQPTKVQVTATGVTGSVTGWTATVTAPAGCSASATAPGPDSSVLLDVTSCVAAAEQAMAASGQSTASFDVTIAVTWDVAGSQQVQDVSPPPVTLTAQAPTPVSAQVRAARGTTATSSGGAAPVAPTGAPGPSTGAPTPGAEPPGAEAPGAVERVVSGAA